MQDASAGGGLLAGGHTRGGKMSVGRKWWVAAGLAGLLAAPAAQAAEGPAFFAGGGAEVGGVRYDLSAINSRLPSGVDPLPETMITFHGSGAGGATGWTLGGFGGGGEASSGSGDQGASLSVGFGGFEVTRLVGLGPRVTGLLALGVGGGGATLRVRHTAPSGSDPLGSATDTVLESSFFVLLPSAGLRLQLAPMLWLDARAGYLFAPGSQTWTWQSYRYTLSPLHGPMLRLGLLFGVGD